MRIMLRRRYAILVSLPYLILLFFSIGLMTCTPKINDELNQASSTGQDTTVVAVVSTPVANENLLFSIPIQSKYFTTDKLNQLYLVTDRNELIKYDVKGKEVFRYNNNFLEDLSLVDVTDPFNILLYYPDYLSVITLDRTLNQTGTFDLSSLNLTRVQAIGTSNDNNVWIYDEVSFKLKKLNRSGLVLRQSVDLNLQLGYAPKPNFLLERENGVYLSDPKYGVLIFNLFGEYQSVLEEQKGIARFQVFENQLIYKKGTKLFSYHLKSLSKQEIKLPVQLEITDKVSIQKNRLYVKKANRVDVYSL